MIKVNKNECTVDGNNTEIMADLTVAMAAFFQIIGDEEIAVRMLLHCMGVARVTYEAGQYRQIDQGIKEILKKLSEMEGD